MSTDMISSLFIMFCVLLGVLLLFGFTRGANTTNQNNDILNIIRDIVFKLFLFAEKQEWSNAEKMEWCLKEIHKQFPYIPIADETLEKIAQDLYDEYKDFVLKLTQIKN